MRLPDEHDRETPLPKVLEQIEQGIEAAKSGNRLSARWKLESVLDSKALPPEVWLWLAWVAESPAKAQRYLNQLGSHRRLANIAQGGLDWLTFLAGDTTTELPLPAAAASGAKSLSAGADPYEYRVECPECKTVLCVRPSVIGEARHCPACDFRIQFSLEGDGNVHARRDETYVPVVDEAVPTPVAEGNQGQETILVVDDSPTIRRLTTMILSTNGYRVLTAKTGEQGLVMVNQHFPRLILLDINMPGIGGYETCKRLRSNKATSHIPVVMLSGKDGFFDQVKGYQAGAFRYLTKPCEVDLLLSTVKKMLSRTTVAK